MCKNDTIKNIAKNWFVAAEEEDINKYFYSYKEVDSVIDGEKCFIIGRKGSGKSALRKFIINIENQRHDVFAENLSFKNFPFEQFFNNADFSGISQFSILWEYIIYLEVCKMMIKNNSLQGNIRNGLEKLFPHKKISELYDDVLKWTSLQFDIVKLADIFGISIRFQNSSNNLSIYEKNNIIRDIVLNYCGQSTYYLVFDELDEDFRTINDLSENSNYYTLLLSLYKAVQTVKISSNNCGLNIRPILLLRDDIYNNLDYPDKNKWNDSLLKLTWTPEKLKELLPYRINKDNNQLGHSYKNAMASIFKVEGLSYDAVFDRIIGYSQLRPRDVITYIKCCCEKAIETGKDFVNWDVLEKAELVYCERLLQEIEDEIHPLFAKNTVKHIWNLLSVLNKEFTSSDFITNHNMFRTWDQLKDVDSYRLLSILFDYNIIGNIYGDRKNRSVTYKYKKSGQFVNYGATLIMHPSIYQALLGTLKESDLY